MESLQAESDIQIHHQDLDYEWLRLPEEDLEERLQSHLLMPWVEIVGEEEYAMNEEKVPNVCQDYQMNNMGIEEILAKDHKANLGETTKTIEEPQDFLGKIHEIMTMTLEVQNDK